MLNVVWFFWEKKYLVKTMMMRIVMMQACFTQKEDVLTGYFSWILYTHLGWYVWGTGVRFCVNEIGAVCVQLKIHIDFFK